MSYLYKLISFKRENYKRLLKMPNYSFIPSKEGGEREERLMGNYGH